MAAPSIPASRAAERSFGLAHLAAVAFVGSRVAPAGGFWIALAGGVAIARASARSGLRVGYGVSLAALVQSIALMGPLRISIPLTQAMNAPLIGSLEARGARPGLQIAAAALVRLAFSTASTALFIWVVLGGLDAYAGTYDWLTSRLTFLPSGAEGVLALTAASLIGWAAFASPIQVWVCRRGLRDWPTGEPRLAPPEAETTAARVVSRAFDPRAVALAAVVAFAVLAITVVVADGWPVLAAVAAWLAAAWIVAGRFDRGIVRVGLGLAAILAGAALFASLLGGLGLDTALQRAVRAALLVGVATWLRGAAGAEGLREVAERTLRRVRIVPATTEAARLLGGLGSGSALLPAARTLVDELEPVRRRPVPLADAMLRWVAAESHGFHPAPPDTFPRLGVRLRDLALVALAAATAATLLL